ncbi:MAG: membrane protein insertion efficiency factor YidD [Clostridia bacterium]|nr:membrane protein insertion efficiency factor YidD [Clostridia bacterium]
MLKKLFILPIRFYQKFISPNKPPCCRFTPTCSQYAIEAIMEWGVIVGLILALWRILRCNPFGGYGEDPVPVNKLKRRFLERRKAKKEAKALKKASEKQNQGDFATPPN